MFIITDWKEENLGSGKTTVASFSSSVGCIAKDQKKKNKPAFWEKLPKKGKKARKNWEK